MSKFTLQPPPPSYPLPLKPAHEQGPAFIPSNLVADPETTHKEYPDQLKNDLLVKHLCTAWQEATVRRTRTEFLEQYCLGHKSKYRCKKCGERMTCV